MNYELLDINQPLEGRTQHPWYKPAIIFMLLVFYLNSLAAPWERGILFFLAFVLVVISRVFLKRKWYKKEDVIGNIQLDTHQIMINNQQVHLLDEIQSIKLSSNGHWGMNIQYPTTEQGMKLSGATELEIKYKNGLVYDYRFITESKQHYENLKDFLSECYRRDLEVTELIGYKNKAFLMKAVGEMTYAEIQTIKKDLQIRS